MTTKTLSALVQSFFTLALPQRGMSPLTILSYRDAMKLLLRFVAERKRRPVVRLQVADLDASIVRDFLDHLEKKRGNGIATRNNRLAAIRSFFGFVAAEEPALADLCQHVCAVPLKRAPVRPIPYLEEDEMQALLAGPDRSTAASRRDHALLLFLYNTAARVQELTGVRASDLHLARPSQVLLRGKRKKERICPFWASTARALRALLAEAAISPGSDRKVFLNTQGEPLTRFGVDYIIKKYAPVAAVAVPSLARKRISPHTIRHTAAVHMLNAGVDVNVIRSWLGHADLRTTNVYAEINLATKRKAIESCAPRGVDGRARRPSWKRSRDLLAWLEQL
jgi:site-specific recombinase XerD